MEQVSLRIAKGKWRATPEVVNFKHNQAIWEGARSRQKIGLNQGHVCVLVNVTLSV